MNDLGSYEQNPLEAMNCLGFFTWKTLGRELRALDDMNSLELWMKWMSYDLMYLGL